MTRQIQPIQLPSGSIVPGAVALPDGQVLIGNSSGVAAAQSLSGGVTISDTGVATLGSPGVSAKGGVKSLAAIAHNFLTQLATDGTLSQAQPAFADLSDGSSGTWTPVDSSGAALVFVNPIGTFWKLGKLVFVAGQLTFPTTVNGTNAIIGGLPFTTANLKSSNTPGSLTSTAALVTDFLFNQNTTAFSILLVSGVTPVTNASLSGATIAFAGCYISA